MSSSNYKKLTHEEHIRKISDMYVGSDQRVERVVRVFDGENFGNVTTVFPEAGEFLFLEVLSNASDNVLRSRLQDVKHGDVKVWMDGTTVIVQNGGIPIPVEMHPDYEVWTPELIFGNLLTSSNYEGERKVGGVYGLGSKLVNLYSTYFAVEIGDATRGLSYLQTWGNYMKERSEPEVKEYKGKSYVKVAFTLDLSRFGYETYPEEAVALFAAHVADLSLTAKVKTFFNDVPFDFTRIEKYADLFGAPYVTYKNKEKTIEVVLMDTEHANVISFANTKLTRQGGTHTEAVYKSLAPFLKLISRTKKLTLRDIKPQLSMIVNVHVVDPRWADQMKTGLKFPEIKLAIPDATFKKMLNWDLVKRLCLSSEAKSLSGSDGKKRKHIKVDNLQDANLAGTNKSMDCSLYVVEGLSASGYAENMRDHLAGRDYIGVYPLRGKLLNVMNANSLKIADNKVISKIKEVLGLREGVDYTEEKNLKTLRYRYLFILTDADVDGLHICGLILNFFYCRFPSLLQIGFVMYLRTPIVRLNKGKKKLNFFTDGEYLRWKSENPDYKTWEHKYCKGLGSSSDKEIKEDSVSPRVVVCIYDDNTAEAMKLAFNEDMTDMRKEWIDKFQDQWFGTFSVEGYEEKAISEFINQELIRFSLDNMLRSIPRMMDGLKISQRKILWGAMDQWKNWHSGKKFPQMKVKILTSKASYLTAYKHGEDCLAKTVILMTQDFVGANNMPYFVSDGQFGTRVMMGKDAADPRYPFTCPQEWLKYVYKKEDEPLLDIIEDEGQQIEPVSFLPIIPMILVNGAQGIGTGWSCFVPNHNPLELVDWLEKRIKEEEREEILPWYQGFQGDIDVKRTPKGGLSMCTTGKFYSKGKDVFVTELPIGKGSYEYEEKTVKPLLEEKTIKDYRNGTKHDVTLFELYDFVGKPTVNKLKLQKSSGLSNMVLLDLNDRPKRYETPEDILEDFYTLRLGYYGKRKENQLQALLEKVKKINLKIKLVLAVLDGEVVVNNKKKSEVVVQLDRLGIPASLLKEVNLYSLTYEQVEKLRREGEEAQASFDLLQNKPPEHIWLQELDEFKQFWLKQK
ncbi:topoisomerase IIA [Cedratvirus lausannensis]|uniref:DNA topoisomerase 2 n=1 Tax=Cedratvirus lausannensis TaxID=2023205 RepID=A0A285Q1G7_9VIRU|nr:topoisomerase IIA [Cedratvirus lausannensis]